MLPQAGENTNIKLVKTIRLMSNHVKSYNFVLVVVDLKVGQAVATITIKYKKEISPDCSSFGVLAEILNPFKDPIIDRQNF